MELSEEARKARNQRAREYYRKHPERQKEYNRRYWEKKTKTNLDNQTEVMDDSEKQSRP